jgi:hypothetical protein
MVVCEIQSNFSCETAMATSASIVMNEPQRDWAATTSEERHLPSCYIMMDVDVTTRLAFAMSWQIRVSPRTRCWGLHPMTEWPKKRSEKARQARVKYNIKGQCAKDYPEYSIFISLNFGS